MDLALSFSSPERRNLKFEPLCSLFRNNSYDNNALGINIPMESDSSNSVFESVGGCRVTRWAFPNYNSNLTSRPTQFNKSGPSIHKVMVPKMPPISITVSQQTIVGGFVGSKSHAGRSLFGDSNQIWDAIICNLVEIMSLAKENAAVDIPRSKSPIHSNKYSSECTLGVPENNPNMIPPMHNISVSENSISISSKILDSCIIELSSNAEITPETRQNSPRCEMSSTSNQVVSQFYEPTILCKNIPSPQKKTYSSIVDGTCNNKAAQAETYAVVNPKSQERVSEIHEDSSPPPPKQSYADVAKIIPHKLVVHQNKSGCEMAKNLILWSSKTKGNINPSRSNREKKVVKQNKSCRSYHSGDILANGCARWKEDWKLKRDKFQKKRPMAMSVKNQSCPNSNACGTETGVNGMNTKEDTFLNGTESNLLREDKELDRTVCSDKGYRGRYSSECSLDSDDSFVVFEDCPDSTSSTSLQSFDHNSSIEEDKLADDYISSSSDDSDSEDDYVDIRLQHADLNHMAPSSHKRKCCEWENKCSAPTVPESKFKGIQKKTVHFAEGSHLAVVRPMIAWGYAYRESRRGPWEVHARDRARFHFRIESLAPVLNLVLDPRHRRRVLASRFSNHGI